MPEPLNPTLYQTLQAQFGEVRVSNAGQGRIASRVPDPGRPGRFTSRVSRHGEQYAVSCPFCGDTRFRLYVSYMCGEPDPVTGERNYSLWYCQNQRCHESQAHRQVFKARLAVPIDRRHLQAPAAPAPAPPQPITVPESLIRISSLPETDPVPTYLRQRGFDIQCLEQTWEVSFCNWCLNCNPIATRRLFIPVYRPVPLFWTPEDGPLRVELAGWQARSVPGEVLLGGSDAKYLSAAGMQKAELLYGLPLAIQTTGPVHVVEGAADCWRIGPGAVGLFGKSLSLPQKALLVHHFAGRPVFVMLDRDAGEDARAVQRALALARSGSPGNNRVLLRELPPGRKDPAECTPQEIAACHVS
ncbi:MAG: hypothetical protein ABSF26_19800 [Thermoguttaceae bacterium]|jgi:hypothetical protein